MKSDTREWVYHDPRWWIDQIAAVCTPEFSEPQFRYPVDDYFTDLKDRLAGTLTYLSGHRNLTPYEARRSLFFAKAMKKWKLPLGPIDAKERSFKAMVGFYERNLAAASDEYVPKYACIMRDVLSRWLPEIGIDGFHGKFGPGACAEGWPHPQRFCRLEEWVAAGVTLDTCYTGHADTEARVCRLAAVPKDWDKDRLITVEPCFGTYVQQLVRSVLIESIHAGPLRGTAMDLGYTDGQAIQRRLALEASRTGRRATIDLSDASDSVSWAAVQATFPEWVVDLLWRSRSCAYTSRDVMGGTPQTLYMFAGMGNATTFVVETLFFSAYAVAVQMVHPCKKAWVSTFGDDIIVSSECCEWLLEEGDQPFFRINRSKSFLGHDAIRESCGIFAYLGNDITVPKVDGYPETYQGACGIADLHHRLLSSGDAFQVLLASRIARCGLLDNWPFAVDGHPSICDWSAEFSALPRTRYNSQYQIREACVKDARPESVHYDCSDAFVDDELDPDVLGLDSRQLRTAQFREYQPPANVWYQARLLGLLSTDPLGVLREKDVRASRPSRVSFPTGKLTMRSRWARCLPAGSDPLVRAKYDSTFATGRESMWDKVLRGQSLALHPGDTSADSVTPYPSR